MFNSYRSNTLQYDPDLCIGYGMCYTVCPHGVFGPNGRTAQVVNPEACIECGACQMNCPASAIRVDSGVGCAAAMIHAALTGRKDTACEVNEAAESAVRKNACCGEGGTPCPCG